MNPMEHGVIVKDQPPTVSDRQVALLAAAISFHRYPVSDLGSLLRHADKYLEWLQK